MNKYKQEESLLNKHNKQSEQKQQIIITEIQEKQNFIDSIMALSSLVIVRSALNHILQQTEQFITENKIIKTKRNPFAAKFEEIYSNQAVLLELSIRQMKSKFFQEAQATPLRSDNLIPTGTNIEQKYPAESQKMSISPQNISRMARNSSNLNFPLTNRSRVASQSQPKRIAKVYEYIKLKQQDLPKTQVSFDPLIEQMRRQKQANLKQKQQSKQQQKKSNLKEIIKKDEKISFDFTGDIIKIKQSSQKTNFQPNSVKANENQSLTVKQKLPKIDVNPTCLDGSVKKDLSKRNLSKKTNDIQFSNIVSLVPELQIKEGVKFTHNKATIEKKKKQSSIIQLKKGLSSRRLSKNDFQRLKSLGQSHSVRSKGDSPSLPTILKSETDLNDRNSSILGKSFSEAKLQAGSSRKNKYNNKFLHQKYSERVNIENEQLTSILLQTSFNSLQETAKLSLPTSQIQNKQKTETLSAIDLGNLQFIKTGSVGKQQLPKISYRINKNTADRHENTFLKQKSKLKGKRKQNEFQRLRKHFQDKLRI